MALKSAKDERGKKLVPEIEPETDTMQRDEAHEWCIVNGSYSL